VAADFDLDGDVDQEDFVFFQSCLSGPGVMYPAGCEIVDTNSDNDVDQDDFNAFNNCMNGANQLPNCL